VILRELPDHVAADQVRAAVADVADPGAIVAQDDGGAGRPHAAEIGVRAAAVVHDAVRFLDRGLEVGEQILGG